jgi:hypothetical protein
LCWKKPVLNGKKSAPGEGREPTKEGEKTHELHTSIGM